MFGYLLHKNTDREARQRLDLCSNVCIFNRKDLKIRNKESLENIKLSNSNLAEVSGVELSQKNK